MNALTSWTETLSRVNTYAHVSNSDLLVNILNSFSHTGSKAGALHFAKLPCCMSHGYRQGNKFSAYKMTLEVKPSQSAIWATWNERSAMWVYIRNNLLRGLGSKY